MTGESDLATLLRGLSPHRNDGEFVFVTVAGGEPPAGVRPVVSVREDEGLALVVARAEADDLGLPYR